MSKKVIQFWRCLVHLLTNTLTYCYVKKGGSNRPPFHCAFKSFFPPTHRIKRFMVSQKKIVASEMALPVSCRLLLFIMLIIMLPISITAQSYSNVTLGSSIVANSTNSTWISPSREFAFGFQQVAPGGGYLLAIWFDKIPEKTIVWSANRDKLAPEGSRIQLLADGRLELNDPRGQQIWGANNLAGSGRVDYGAMLDSGDFVLASNTSAILWRSFDEPTDTLLPAQILNQGVSLISSFSQTNYSRGRFKFIMQKDGNLVLYTRNFPMDDGVSAYWETATVGSGFQLIFNQSGYVYLTERNGTILSYLSSNGASTSQFYQRLKLEYDGIVGHYVYPKSANSAGGRAMAWSVNPLLPPNICTRSLFPRGTGGGVCGFNSLCSLGADRRPICECPFGYSPMDPTDKMSGCKPDFVQQSCNQQSQETELFRLIDMSNANWPNSDYAFFPSVGEDWCRQSCLGDCFCALAIHNNRGCWKKKYPLSDGRKDPSVGGTAFLKVRINNTTDNPRSNNTTTDNPFGSSPNKSNRSTLIITGSVILGTSVFLNLFLFVFRFNGRKSKKIQEGPVLPGVNIKSFSFDELQEATNGFKEELGNGACSTVYKGALKDDNGKVIAVKKLDKIAKQADKEFKAEVSSISRTNHQNLVQLLGYCDEGQHRILVYEFMSKGSLASYLFENSRPNWYRRVEIAFGTARGLCYLHEECSTQIIHCDIKPQNVLLDESHMPKISDFGLAKLLRPDQTRTTTGIRGTRGYVAPEWFRNMPITVKVDVYSFGILLLELLCCRRNFVPDIKDEGEMILADWAYYCYKEGTLDSLVADDEEAKGDIKLFEKFVMTAIWCIQEDPALRPQMKTVMHMLEGLVEVPAPPDPASFII